jgi:hypothetical protein
MICEAVQSAAADADAKDQQLTKGIESEVKGSKKSVSILQCKK